MVPCLKNKRCKLCMMINFLACNYVSSLFGVQPSLVCSENKLTVEVWIKWYIYTNLQSVLQFITFKQFIHQNQNSKIQKSNIFVTEGPGWKECFLTQIHKLLWLAKTTGKINNNWKSLIIYHPSHYNILSKFNSGLHAFNVLRTWQQNWTSNNCLHCTKAKDEKLFYTEIHHGTYHSRKLHSKRHKIQTAPFSASSASQNVCFARWTRLGLRSRSMPVMARALATASE